jgi:hypothetical protein
MSIEIKEPWTMIPLCEIDYFIDFIKKNLSKEDILKECKIFPEVKISGKDIYIVQDEDTEEFYLIDFYKKKKNDHIIHIGDIDDFSNKMNEKIK